MLKQVMKFFLQNKYVNILKFYNFLIQKLLFFHAFGRRKQFFSTLEELKETNFIPMSSLVSE